MPEMIEDGSYVFIFLDHRRNWIKRVKAGEKFHTNKGIIEYDDIIGRPYGLKVDSHSGKTFQIHRPSQTDIQIAMGRNTQIIYPKDAGTILIEADIHSGCRVVESGTGSGALTSILANAVGETGQVYTYEIREDWHEGAKRNLSKYADMDRITMYNQDILEGIHESYIDAVVLDLATPWLLVEEAHRVLKPSCYIASYSPTIEQVMKTCKAMGESGDWGMIKTLEVMQREIMVRENKTRPTTWMVGHTGYMTFARTFAKEE
ncbi:MAG: tRNA (adenine(57)-N(1)/adenine(58)-N(1))-methyltransferase TrmI [Candidatus Thorarchaeota archaeon]|nr:MAG: tRNA (adenine(57)-N(1)/adenine(58)-N(1))-methyltransferase TrmI [Candidatus Thorarchaeota archaeon]